MNINYEVFKNINNIISIIFTIMMFHKTIYFIIGIFFTKKFKISKNKHKYAILIPAHNEENVIGNLIDSINKQDYPKELLTIFVVSDNSNDDTATIAKNKGAKVYEHFNYNEKTKGYALKYLIENIDKDYDINNFEGYFIFDADNLLKKDYISKMNDAFDSGEKVITSYRNSKNFDENIISSTYAIHWLRSIRFDHRARSILNLATNIQGTGFLFANETIKEGWKYTSLTEDRAFTADLVKKGYKITYQNDAMFYDEQPTKLKVALIQRLRWSRGHIEAFIEVGPKLFLNLFKNSPNNKKEDKFITKLIENIRFKFASYDTLIQLTPFSVINIFRWFILSIVIYNIYNYTGIVNLIVTIISSIGIKILNRLLNSLTDSLVAIYVFFIERKNIKKMKLYKKIIFILCFPIFNIIGVYTSLIAVFKKVEWTKIPHDSKIKIEDLYE